ncbi:MAG: HAD family hydrolase [Phycisphaeraceae bacterium]
MNHSTPARLWLVLFDIDGTLLITRGAGSRCIRRACREIFGDAFAWGGITVGTLDPQIFADLCAFNGIESPAEHHERYRDCYLGHLERELERVREDVTVLPGVAELLAALNEREDVIVGLLSGNYGDAARIKLQSAGFDLSRFEVQAFAEHGETRDELLPAAMAQYAELTGDEADPARVIVVGDTPRDVACARSRGCRCLAVATGRYGEQQLRDAGAEVVVRSLAEPGGLRAMLDAPARASGDAVL